MRRIANLAQWTVLGIVVLTGLGPLAGCGSESKPPSPAAQTTADITAKWKLARISDAVDTPAWRVEREANSSTTQVHQEFSGATLLPAGIPGLFTRPLALTSRGQAGASQLDRDLLGIEGARLPAPETQLAAGIPNRLFQGEQELSYITWTEDLDLANGLAPGIFTTIAGTLYVMPLEGWDQADFRFVASLDQEREPAAAGNHTKVDIGASSFHGASLVCGDELRVDIECAKGAELLFSTSARGADQARPTLEVRLGNELIWAKRLPTTDDYGAVDSWRIELPGDAESIRGSLAFQLVMRGIGDPTRHGLVHILAPSITRPAESASGPKKPDIALFLADTFRADNLAASGGNPGIAPKINAFVEQSVYFDAACTPASWTLPSQASLLTGVHPARHGAVIDLISLDERLRTLPELLGQAGYRTVAVTEGGFVVPIFGMDQGFETFLVGAPLDIEGTLARVRQMLERDDGRPLFLFVQTFRAHSDYIATEAAMANLPGLFGKSPDPNDWIFSDLLDQLFAAHGPAALDTPGTNGRLSEAIAHNEIMENIHALYRGASHDTDAGFGSFLGLLEEAGLGDAPTIFTSDHGEAFGEHNIFGHANNCYEETLRIPLAIRAPGYAPRITSAPVSLLDLGPTICELVDIPAPELWEGRSLVGLLTDDQAADPKRRIFSFECPSETDILPAEFALRMGPHKLMGSLDAEGLVIESSLVGFDLASDPGEKSPIPFTEAAPWMDELRIGLEEELETLQISLHPPRKVNLSPEESARLRAMGYLGE